MMLWHQNRTLWVQLQKYKRKVKVASEREKARKTALDKSLHAVSQMHRGLADAEGLCSELCSQVEKILPADAKAALQEIATSGVSSSTKASGPLGAWLLKFAGVGLDDTEVATSVGSEEVEKPTRKTRRGRKQEKTKPTSSASSSSSSTSVAEDGGELEKEALHRLAQLRLIATACVAVWGRGKGPKELGEFEASRAAIDAAAKLKKELAASQMEVEQLQSVLKESEQRVWTLERTLARLRVDNPSLKETPFGLGTADDARPAPAKRPRTETATSATGTSATPAASSSAAATTTTTPSTSSSSFSSSSSSSTTGSGSGEGGGGNDRVEELESQLAKLEGEVDAAKALAEAREKEVVRANEALSKAEEKHAASLATIAKARKGTGLELVELEKQLEAEAEKRAAAEDRAQGLEAEVNQLRTRLESALAKVKGGESGEEAVDGEVVALLRKDVEEVRKQRVEAEEKLASVTQELAAAEADVKEVSELRAMVKRYSGEVEALQAENAELSRGWGERVRSSPGVKEAVGELEAQIARLNAQVTGDGKKGGGGGGDVSAMVEKAKAEASAAKAAAAAAQAEKDGMMSMVTTLSTSYETLKGEQKTLREAETQKQRALRDANAALGKAKARARSLESEAREAVRRADELQEALRSANATLMRQQAAMEQMQHSLESKDGEVIAARSMAESAKSAISAFHELLDAAAAGTPIPPHAIKSTTAAAAAGHARAQAVLEQLQDLAIMKASAGSLREEVDDSHRGRKEAKAVAREATERALAAEKRLARYQKRKSSGVDRGTLETTLRTLKKMVRCPIKPEHGYKSATLGKCGHCFARATLDELVRNRNRKCPICHMSFDKSDIIDILLTV